MFRSAFCAIKKAVMAFRKDVGQNDWVDMVAPAMLEVVRTACDVRPEDLTA